MEVNPIHLMFNMHFNAFVKVLINNLEYNSRYNYHNFSPVRNYWLDALITENISFKMKLLLLQLRIIPNRFTKDPMLLQVETST